MSNGYLRVRGNLSKAGVFEYDFRDEKVRELRAREEVFRTDSLDTLVGCPVTVDHPREMKVTPATATRFSVGTVIEAHSNDPYIEGTLQIHDAKAIAMVEAKALVEISLGYNCDPVEHNDSNVADVAQCNIRYNHCALGPQGWARLGGDLTLRLDSKGDIDFSSFRIDANGRELLQNLDNYDEATLAIVLAHFALAL
jgi:hypothetical protein